MLTSMKNLKFTPTLFLSLSLSLSLSLGSLGRKLGGRYFIRTTIPVKNSAFEKVQRHFYCQRNRQFLSQNVLQHTPEM